MSETSRSSAPTIFEVAQEAGVSITTVSHVFSSKRPVSQETRRRVLEASNRLNYRASRTARSLATGRTMVLGVQVPLASAEILFNPYFAQLLPSLSETAVALGYTFALVPPNPSVEGLIVPLVERKGIEAGILIDPHPGDPFVRALLEAQTPFVSLGRVPEAPTNPRVDQDFDSAMSMVVTHVQRQGYKHLAFFTLEDEMTSIFDIRMAFEHLAPDATVVFSPDLSDGAAFNVALELLSGRSRPDAVICLTERHALGLYRAAEVLGLLIPQDVGVISFGESDVSRGLRPPATSVCVFPEQSGEQLVRIVHRMLQGEDVPALTLVPTELRVRTSTQRTR